MLLIHNIMYWGEIYTFLKYRSPRNNTFLAKFHLTTSSNWFECELLWSTYLLKISYESLDLWFKLNSTQVAKIDLSHICKKNESNQISTFSWIIQLLPRRKGFGWSTLCVWGFGAPRAAFTLLWKKHVGSGMNDHYTGSRDQRSKTFLRWLKHCF